jgi:hypothetical protein
VSPGRLGGLLSLAAGFVFIVLGFVGFERSLTRVFVGVALVAVGTFWSRR